MKTIMPFLLVTALTGAFAFTPLLVQAQDTVSVSRCFGQVEGRERSPGNLPTTFESVAYVWINGERTMIQVGERGLTRTILFNPELLLQWALENFNTGLVVTSIGFNDCWGTQTFVTDTPFSPEQEDAYNPANFPSDPIDKPDDVCEVDCPPDDRG